MGCWLVPSALSIAAHQPMATANELGQRPRPKAKASELWVATCVGPVGFGGNLARGLASNLALGRMLEVVQRCEGNFDIILVAVLSRLRSKGPLLPSHRGQRRLNHSEQHRQGHRIPCEVMEETLGRQLWWEHAHLAQQLKDGEPLKVESFFSGQKSLLRLDPEQLAWQHSWAGLLARVSLGALGVDPPH